MKTVLERQREFRLERIEAEVGGRLGAMFGRIPELQGFSVGVDLMPAEVAVHGWPGTVAGEELYSDIVATLAALLDERPEAADLIRGRTFARSIQ